MHQFFELAEMMGAQRSPVRRGCRLPSDLPIEFRMRLRRLHRRGDCLLRSTWWMRRGGGGQ